MQQPRIFWLGLGLNRALRQLHEQLCEVSEGLRSLLNVAQTQTRILRILMAQNQELVDFTKRMDTATDDIAEDIKRILSNTTTELSPEDRAALEQSVSRLEALASENVPADGGTTLRK